MKKHYFLSFVLLLSSVFYTEGQFYRIYSFRSQDGHQPYGNVTISNGKIFGMTSIGGANNDGCIFSVDSNGNRYKDLLDFNGTNGNQPHGSLVIAGNRLYGMTNMGGTNGLGNIFIIDTNGNGYIDLHDFTTIDGKNPNASLILANNMLYGVTTAGGTYGYGTVFTIDTNGNNFHKLLDFDSFTYGAGPRGSLVLSGKMLYGMSFSGAAMSYGCIFGVDTNGGEKRDLYDFDGSSHGRDPYGSLIASGSTLYGMTADGGNWWGIIFSIDTSGSAYTILHNFNDTIGANPFGDLTLVNGVLYGMASTGTPSFTYGCIFSINTNGTGYTDHYNFSPANGETPYGSLTFYHGTLYGMTLVGGLSSDGVIFGMSNIPTGSDNSYKERAIVSLFPNPNGGKFTIATNNLSEKAWIDIYDVMGQKIYNGSINGSIAEVDLSNHPSGIYLYKIHTLNGNLISEGKFIIQR